ncbi:MAG: menaquinone biosynthesis protein [Vicinamibacterales bacterium]
MTPELPEGGGRVRLGAVGYLNARPLVHGLDADPRFALRFDVPAVCAQLLHQGAIDFGLIPAIESAREPDYAIVRDAAVASFGPVDSVAIYTQKPLEQVTTLALDTSSRTSAALVRVLCRFHFGIAPTFQSVGPDIRDMLQRCDAALLIGDPALFLDPASLGVEKIDLGEQWTAFTGLPFVWAFWVGRRAQGRPETLAALEGARRRGEAALDEIARQHSQGDSARRARIERYLRESIHYDLDDRCEAGLRKYFELAGRIGIIPGGVAPQFFERVSPATMVGATAARMHDAGREGEGR